MFHQKWHSATREFSKFWLKTNKEVENIEIVLHVGELLEYITLI
jgi:hypothetical protein